MGISGGLTPDNLGVEYCCVLYAFDESPAQQGVFYAGSNDGLVHVSRDDGQTWTNVTDNIPDLPPDGVARRIDASDQVAASFGMDRDRPTLTHLVERAPIHQRTRLVERRDRLRSVFKLLGAEARTIHDVLRMNFTLVDRMLSTLLGVTTGGETYDSLGGRRKAEAFRLIDQTA